jgi:hypothetical protein
VDRLLMVITGETALDKLISFTYDQA